MMDEVTSTSTIEIHGSEIYDINRSPLNAHIAHELCHAIGIRHHGDGDEGEVFWSVMPTSPAQLLFPTLLYEDMSPIHVYDSTGIRLLDSRWLIKHCGAPLCKVYVGRRYGQHSGDADCVMRYHVADAYEKLPNLKTERFYSPGDKARGIRLCDSPDGTVFNSENHKPQSEFGPADCGHGDCVHQFVISDKYDKPLPPPRGRRCK